LRSITANSGIDVSDKLHFHKFSQNITFSVVCWRTFGKQIAAAYNVTYAMSDRVLWSVTRACSLAGRYIQYTYQGPILRETIKGATTTCNRIGPPIYFYVKRRVRHRKLSSSPRCTFCRGSLFFADRPLSVIVPERSQSSFIGKVAIGCHAFGPLPRSTNYQSNSALSLFFATFVRRKHMKNLILSRDFGAFFSSRWYEHINDNGISQFRWFSSLLYIG